MNWLKKMANFTGLKRKTEFKSSFELCIHLGELVVRDYLKVVIYNNKTGELYDVGKDPMKWLCDNLPKGTLIEDLQVLYKANL